MSMRRDILEVESMSSECPKGMRILNGGVLTWTPTKSQVGDYSVLF